MARVQINSGPLDGAEGVLQRMYWEGDRQLADVMLSGGRSVTIEIMRRDTPREQASDASSARELGS